MVGSVHKAAQGAPPSVWAVVATGLLVVALLVGGLGWIASGLIGPGDIDGATIAAALAVAFLAVVSATLGFLGLVAGALGLVSARRQMSIGPVVHVTVG